jgi:hypothetical protein
VTWNPETNDLVRRILVGVDGSACSLIAVAWAAGTAPYHGILRGTVTQACVHAAPCPVVIVPFPHQPSHPDRGDTAAFAGQAYPHVAAHEEALVGGGVR